MMSELDIDSEVSKAPQTTQDVVREAFNKSREEEVETPAAVEESEEVTEKPLSEAQAKRKRDEAGRFSKKEAEEPEAAKPEAVEEPAEPASKGGIQLTTEKPPSSWSPTAREHWKALPEEVKKDVIRREQDAANRHSQLEKEYAPVKTFLQHVSPHVEDLARRGIQVGPHVAAILQTERGLMANELPTRFQTLLQIADAYKIPLRKIINESVGSQVLGEAGGPQSNVPPEIMQELQGIREWRSQMEQQTVNAQVDAWGSQKEFYTDVAPRMADLLAIGAAKDIDDAYDQACLLHPEIREILRSRELNTIKQSGLAKKQSAAVRGSLPSGGKVDVEDDSKRPRDTQSVVRAAVNRAKSQRV